MNFLNLLFDHFWEIIIFLAIFGGSIGTVIRGTIRQHFEHVERMQEKRNEELRLRVQLEQMKLGITPPHQSAPSPKDALWSDPVETPYEMGYQEIHQQE